MATLTTSYQKLGEAYLGNSYGSLYIRIYAKYSEQDITNNRTKVQYQARAYFSGNSYILDQQSSGNVKGTSASQVNYSRSSSYSSGETTLGTTEAWVSHNNDGTMSISASAYLNFPNWGWSNTASGTADLPTIPRASKITATSANIEETSQITVTQYSTNFRNSIRFSFGSLNKYIKLDGSVSDTEEIFSSSSTNFAIGFQIPSDWYYEIPNDQEGLCTLTITTYNGNDAIGTNTCTFYARVGGNVSVSSTVQDINDTTYALTGNRNILIKGYSNARVTWSASPTTGSSLTSVLINGNSVSSSPYDFVLADTQISIVATDSRGKNNAANPNHPSFTLKNYARPTISVTAEREQPTSGNINLSFEGTFFNDSFGSVSNSLTIAWLYRESGTTNWINGGTLVLNSNYKVSGNNFWSGTSSSKSNITVGNDSLNYEKSWDIAVVVVDRLSSLTIINEIPIGIPTFNNGADFFNINGKLNIWGITIIKHIANVLWPVGSIYISLTQDLPSFLSGEWTLLDTLVNGSQTYYIYERTSEYELLCYNGEPLLINGENIYIDHGLLKGDDVL